MPSLTLAFLAASLASAESAGLPPVGLLAEAGMTGAAGVVLKPQLATSASIRSWSLELVDWKGRAVNRFEGLDAPPRALQWLGAGRKGALAESGFYKARLSVQTGEGRLESEPALFSFLRPKELGEMQHVTLFYEDSERMAVQLPE